MDNLKKIKVKKGDVEAFIYPFWFAIPDQYLLNDVPKTKSKPFAPVIPGNKETYQFKAGQHGAYFKSYQQSYFGFTSKKSGWDCLRHYEILANGCVPYFLDIESCPNESLCHLPKKELLAARKFEGISVDFHVEKLHIRGIDWEELRVTDVQFNDRLFDEPAYYALTKYLLDYTRRYLTTSFLGKYIIEKLHLSKTGKVLFLSEYPDIIHYGRSLSLYGLKQILGEDRVEDCPRIKDIYALPLWKRPFQKIYDSRLYGNGFSYSRLLKDTPKKERNDLYHLISKGAFEAVVMNIGPYAEGELAHWEIISNSFPSDKIAILDGMDAVDKEKSDKYMFTYADQSQYFRRELDCSLYE